jgi:hypothetical protein
MQKPVPAALAKSRMLWHRELALEASLKDYEARQAVALKTLATAEKQCHVHILDPKPYLCDKEKCSAMKGDKALYKDDNHLSTYGSLLLEPMFVKALK